MLLKKYFFATQVVIANQEHKPSEEIHIDVNTNVAFVKNDKIANEYTIELRVSTNKEKSKNIPYIMDLICVGIFDAQKTVHKEVFIRGSQILAGAIRERVLSLTGRGPWKSISIHLIEFDIPTLPIPLPGVKNAKTH